MSIWQQAGAFLYTAANRGKQIQKFGQIGGKWVCVLIYNDVVVEATNRSLIPAIKNECAPYNIEVWGWFNGRGGDDNIDAANIAKYVNQFKLTGAILDLEAEYQHPGGNAALMPVLCRKVRKALPNTYIGVSTNGMNNSMIYNGRNLNPPQSFYDMGVRCLPQWYSSYYNKDASVKPQVNMAWLQKNGNTDYNFRDSNAPKTSYRGLPLSYVHPTIEVTGLEGSNMSQELADLTQTKKFGLTPGFSIYTLENCPDTDFSLMAQVRGKLYL